jgi:hypothetical protein
MSAPARSSSTCGETRRPSGRAHERTCSACISCFARKAPLRGSRSHAVFVDRRIVAHDVGGGEPGCERVEHDRDEYAGARDAGLPVADIWIDRDQREEFFGRHINSLPHSALGSAALRPVFSSACPGRCVRRELNERLTRWL